MQERTATSSKSARYEVLRPICMAGERVEVGSVIELPKVLGQELAAAQKVVVTDRAVKAMKPKADKAEA